MYVCMSGVLVRLFRINQHSPVSLATCAQEKMLAGEPREQQPSKAPAPGSASRRCNHGARQAWQWCVGDLVHARCGLLGV